MPIPLVYYKDDEKNTLPKIYLYDTCTRDHMSYTIDNIGYGFANRTHNTLKTINHLMSGSSRPRGRSDAGPGIPPGRRPARTQPRLPAAPGTTHHTLPLLLLPSLAQLLRNNRSRESDYIQLQVYFDLCSGKMLTPAIFVPT